MDLTIRLFECNCKTQMIIVEAGTVKKYPEVLDVAKNWNLPLLEGGDYCPGCDRLLEGQCDRQFVERRDGRWTGDGAEARGLAAALNKAQPPE